MQQLNEERSLKLCLADTELGVERIISVKTTKLMCTKNFHPNVSQFILLLTSLITGLAGAAPEATEAGSTTEPPLRIMCLGDSITAGYTDNPKWRHPFEFGYRSGLFALLSKANYNFLMVGDSPEPWDATSGDPSHGGTYKPPLDLREAGQDGHRGYGGKTVGFLNKHILDWLAKDDPDIVLLMIGTNKKDPSGLDRLVDTIIKTKPNCQLIVAQIIPRYHDDQETVDYNAYIRDSLIPRYQGMGHKVTLVDQYTPFLQNSADLRTIDQTLFSNGINHPSNEGYDKMAQVWFDGIESLD